LTSFFFCGIIKVQKREKERGRVMKILVIAIIGTILFMSCQALFHKIKSTMIMRKMEKEKQALNKRIQQHLESKKYVIY
jgi:putative effector of murein hydrolase LrgA (UPF0299 family)